MRRIRRERQMEAKEKRERDEEGKIESARLK